jgi:Fe-S cluster biosynthesis and repair protein YggX
MRFENTSIYNIYNAILGARNPMNSWGKSDSVFNGYNGKIENTEIGENDLDLAQKLIKAGSEHRKFLRQIFVSVDITAPIYWWKEFDTYKVGTVANSTSTMHKLASTPITKDCFEMDDFVDFDLESQDIVFPLKSTWESLLSDLEFCRQKYNETKDKRYWKELIRLLPESWLQKRTVTMNYENILNMVHQRKNHKLSEWSESFINWTKTLPYANEFFFSK